MGKVCVAFDCTNSDTNKECKGKKISFHHFPIKNPKLCNEWIVKLNRTKFNPTKHSVICSEHFEEDCFTYQPFTKRRHIKPGGVPTKFSLSKGTPRRKKTKYESGRHGGRRSRICSWHFKDGKKENVTEKTELDLDRDTKANTPPYPTGLFVNSHFLGDIVNEKQKQTVCATVKYEHAGE